jgi:apolipoprotein N-acyltransferase
MRRPEPALIYSALAGLLLACAFPRPDFYPLAWGALIPLFVVMEKRPFASGFTAGCAFFGAVLYWLNIVMTTYGGLLPLFSFLAYLFLVVYLALYFGAATWLSCRLKATFGLPVLATMPFVWVALEYLRGVLLTGFPWALLGYSQQNFSAAIQSADVSGVYGISFLLVAVNCAAAWLIVEPQRRLSRFGAVIVVVMTATHVGYGFWRGAQSLEERDSELRVALIQGNIDQAQKWDPENRQATIDRYERLSLQALREPVDLLVWPEAATPFFLQDDTPLSRRVLSLPERFGGSLLVGSPAYAVAGDNRYQYFNSAYLVPGSSAGEPARTDKVHLVPFGEYVPLGRLLSFIDKLVVGVGDFSPGKVTPLALDGTSLGVLICYEVIFPELAREYVRRGSGLLVNLTNDAWFGRSSAPYQHLAMARFRAIENRVWLVRAANTGISAFVSPSGRVVEASPIFTALPVTGTAGIGAEPTFYARFGDLFAYVCVLIAALFSCALVCRRGR